MTQRKHLSEGLCFVVPPGLIYKMKTPLILHQLTKKKAFKRGSSFCSSTRSYLQNENPIDFASDDTIKHLSEGLCFVVRAGLIYKTKTPLILRKLTQRKHLSEGLCFVVRPGLIYKTKTPLIPHQLTQKKHLSQGLRFVV